MSILNTRTMGIEEIILDALSNYVRGRADEIVAKHTNDAIAEIDKSVRDEIAKAVLTVGKMVSYKNMGQEIIITISDKREEKKS